MSHSFKGRIKYHLPISPSSLIVSNCVLWVHLYDSLPLSFKLTAASYIFPLWFLGHKPSFLYRYLMIMFYASSMGSCIIIITTLPLSLFESPHSLSSFHPCIHWTNAIGHLLYHSAAHSDGKSVTNPSLGDSRGIKDYSFEEFLLRETWNQPFWVLLLFRHQVSSLIIWYAVTFLTRSFWEHFNRIFPNLVKKFW